MIAPIDATASFPAGEETVTLAMNFRTIALAEAERADVVTGFGAGKTPTASGVATLVWAFARPAHPELTLDQAMALVFAYGAVAGEALAKLFHAASAPAGDARPPQTEEMTG